MRVIETKVYKFDELSDAAKVVALDAHRYWNVEDHEWWDYTEEWLKEQMQGEGFEDVKIAFSGFCSQGDGASFTCDIDMAKMFLVYAQERAEQLENLNASLWSAVDRALMEWFPEAADIFEGYVSAKITRHHRCGNYVHYNTCEVEVDLGNSYYNEMPVLEGLIQDFAEWLEAHRKQWCGKIYADLEADHDGQISDEAVADSLAANEVEFTEDGESA